MVHLQPNLLADGLSLAEGYGGHGSEPQPPSPRMETPLTPPWCTTNLTWCLCQVFDLLGLLFVAVGPCCIACTKTLKLHPVCNCRLLLLDTPRHLLPQTGWVQLLCTSLQLHLTSWSSLPSCSPAHGLCYLPCKCSLPWLFPGSGEPE